MNILTKNRTEFKPQFLFIDKDLIASKVRQGRSLEDGFNKLAVEVKNLFEKPLTDDELKTVVFGKYPAAISLLKQRAGYPQAEDEVFFKLISMDLSRVKAVRDAFNEFINKFRGVYFKTDEFKVKNGRFVLSKETVDSYEKIATFYTKSEKGNTAFKIARNLCEELNEALKHKLISEVSSDALSGKMLKNLVVPKVDVDFSRYPTNGQQRVVEFMPNYREIASIREVED